MWQKLKLTKFNILELGFFLTIIIGWFVFYQSIRPLSEDSLVDLLFGAGLVSLFISRSSHPRHYWLGYICLVGSVLTNVFDISRATFVLASLALGYFGLGFLNQVLFDKAKE